MGVGGVVTGAPLSGTVSISGTQGKSKSGPQFGTLAEAEKRLAAEEAKYAAAKKAEDFRIYLDPPGETKDSRAEARRKKALIERASRRRVEDAKWAGSPEAGSPELRDCKGGTDLVTFTVDREAARINGKLGALRRHGLKMLEKRDTSFVEKPEFTPYREEIKRFWKSHCNQLARNVGRGRCGVGPSMLVSHAAWQFAMARYYLEKAMTVDDGKEMITLANKLACGGRQNMIAAHTLCAREGTARIMGKEDTPPWLVPEPPKLDPETGEELPKEQAVAEEFEFPGPDE
jgi:hypothetical protein